MQESIELLYAKVDAQGDA
jgi:hypothetical protein